MRWGRPSSGYALGDLRAYRWSGTGFVAVPQTRYPSLQPTTDTPAPVVVLGPVAAALGCPAGTARFGADGTAHVGSARYDINQPGWAEGGITVAADPIQRTVLRHWVELSGRRVLVARINCAPPKGTGGAVVAVLAPDHGALVAVDAVRINGGTAWNFDVENGTLVVIPRPSGFPPTRSEYHWTGTHFVRNQ